MLSGAEITLDNALFITKATSKSPTLQAGEVIDCVVTVAFPAKLQPATRVTAISY